MKTVVFSFTFTPVYTVTPAISMEDVVFSFTFMPVYTVTPAIKNKNIRINRILGS